MAKMKTKRAAKKRFRVRAKGKFSHGGAYVRHNTGKKRPKTKRRLRRVRAITGVDEVLVRRTLPYRYKAY